MSGCVGVSCGYGAVVMLVDVETIWSRDVDDELVVRAWCWSVVLLWLRKKNLEKKSGV